MGRQEVRSFLGGRHKDDRRLYVSTGGFTKDAQYEADRAYILLEMWTLDHVVRALIEHYDTTTLRHYDTTTLRHYRRRDQTSRSVEAAVLARLTLYT